MQQQAHPISANRGHRQYKTKTAATPPALTRYVKYVKCAPSCPPSLRCSTSVHRDLVQGLQLRQWVDARVLEPVAAEETARFFLLAFIWNGAPEPMVTSYVLEEGEEEEEEE